MSRQILLSLTLIFFSVFHLSGQGGFNFDDYNTFRSSVADITASQLQQLYSRPTENYYKGFENALDESNVSFLDSAIIKLNITEGELNLLNQNRFFVTERLSFNSFGSAFHNVYYNDLPVFISTDAILHALHKSYDDILKTVEREIMSTNLEVFLESIFNNFESLVDKYGENDTLEQPLEDAALYVTIAYSLIKDELTKGLPVDEEKLNEVWNAIQNEQMASMPLFAEHTRKIDFSQFVVRGHYVYTQEDMWQGLKSLEPYFRAMMWLGRIDFFLTPPADNPWEAPWPEEDIIRMNLGAFLIHELCFASTEISRLQENEYIIDYLVGESDNILPSEYQDILNLLNVNSAEQLLDPQTYDGYKNAISNDPEFGQKILSEFFFMDPNAEEPDELPVSYRLSGQRFIIDSYILGNVVYDRIIHNGQKVWRPMPHPFDALFALGNNDVLSLLENELNTYPYASQLANLRYLVDAKDEEFWTGSLYNVWLNSIRTLNPSEDNEGLPVFMQTAAWHQEKINTQLASWSQLRHDNLLYAKQSYTGGTGCSFPYSFIEPYPEFYNNISVFASNAANFFNNFPIGGERMNNVTRFFRNFAEVNEKLEIFAGKELAGESFSSDENEWLQSMLFVDGGSGQPPYSGWYSDLYFDTWAASEDDFTVVDVHTQPTDQSGNVVGKVLHTGTGFINLGLFIADSPGSNNPMAFIGPVMSYYQTTTRNFKRMTDQEWEVLVWDNVLPDRPDWTNIYLADNYGKEKSSGAELPSKLFTGISGDIPIPKQVMIDVFPNPFKNNFSIQLRLKEKKNISINLYNSTGVLIHQVSQNEFIKGINRIEISGNYLPPGFYFLKAEIDGGENQTIKIIKK